MWKLKYFYSQSPPDSSHKAIFPFSPLIPFSASVKILHSELNNEEEVESFIFLVRLHEYQTIHPSYDSLEVDVCFISLSDCLAFCLHKQTFIQTKNLLSGAHCSSKLFFLFFCSGRGIMTRWKKKSKHENWILLSR